MELDVSKKVRNAIKAKLLELGVHVDEELPDYIMILIANRRSKEQMEEDLGLFLSENTLKFTTWLYQVLKKLQEVTTSAPAPKPVVPAKNSEQEPPTTTAAASSKQSEVKETTKVETVPTSPEDKSSVKRRKSEAEQPKEKADDGYTSPRSKKLKVSRQPVTSPVKVEPVRTKSQSSVESEERSEKSAAPEPEPSPKLFRVESSVTKKEAIQPVKVASVLSKVTRSKSPVTAPLRRERSPVRTERSRSPLHKKGRNHSPVSVLENKRRHSSHRDRSPSPLLTGSKRNLRSPRILSRNRSKSRSRSGSPVSKARKSLRSLVAVVKRHNELNALKDEEYNPSRPEVTSTSSVASVIHVTPRPKRASKQEGGSNKLLFRALADAQKSIASHAISAKAVSDKERERSEVGDAKGVESSKAKPRKSSESSDASKIGDSKVRKAENSKKLSIKERLGFRLEGKMSIKQRLGSSDDTKRYHENEEAEEYEEDYLPESDDNYKSIIINVPTSKDSKERSVTLENESKRAPPPVTEEPKRLSIQVNVDSDDTSSSEDELEIQPRATEDLNLEPQDEIQKKTGDTESRRSATKGASSESEEADDSRKEAQVTSGKSTPNVEQKGSDTPKDLPLDESSKHSEELEIEEYEEIEEEEDDDEYDVVIQERNIALPDPGEYEPSRKERASNEIEMSAEEASSPAMDTTDGNKGHANGSSSMDVEERGYVPENIRHPLNLRSLNHGDTKFVVTMDGTDDGDDDEDNYYTEEYIMETESLPTRSHESDLRSRISRSVVPSKGFSPPLQQNTYNPPPRPYLPITGAPRPFPPPSGNSAAPTCRYWPECTFKDKCIYPHPKCKYGDSCTKPQCPYKHDAAASFGSSGSAEAGAAAPGSSENDGKVVCKFFPKCHSMSCNFFHPSPCRFGVGCTDAKCKNFHPGQTVGQQRTKNKLFGAVSRPAFRAPPPAAHLLRWKAPAAPMALPDGSDNKQSSTNNLNAVQASTSSA